MTTLNEKATSARDVVRAGESEAQRYRLEDIELTKAGDIGTDDGFPQYGDFLDVTAVDADGDDLGARWVECPADLARAVVDEGISVGDVFVIETARKNEDEAWQFEVSNGQ